MDWLVECWVLMGILFSRLEWSRVEAKLNKTNVVGAKGVFFSFLFLILSFLLVRPKGLTECRST